MAADDELPRGLTLQNASSTNVALVTYPAVPGISWVLTEANGVWTCTTEFGFAAEFTLEINGVPYDASGGLNPVEPGQSGQMSWSGSLTFPVNTAVTVAFNAGGTEFNEIITASAYPI